MKIDAPFRKMLVRFGLVTLFCISVLLFGKDDPYEILFIFAGSYVFEPLAQAAFEPKVNGEETSPNGN